MGLIPLILAGAAFVAVLCGVVYLWRIAPAGAGYKAKVLCSAVHVSRREFSAVLAEDVSVDAYWIMRLFQAREYPQWKEVAASLLACGGPRPFIAPGEGPPWFTETSPSFPAARAGAFEPMGQGGNFSSP